MNILYEIVEHKRKIVDAAKRRQPLRDLEQSPYFDRKGISLSERLRATSALGVIAEFKRRSPSKGDINTGVSPGEVGVAYAEAGAAGISVLTDTKYFGGKAADLSEVREGVDIPILRKDFIIDAYQVYEAKAIGADVILLIAECLDKVELGELATLAHALDMEVLMEVHSAAQLEKLHSDIDMVGVNNRNLETFVVDIRTSLELYDAIPDDFVKISESGLRDATSMQKVKTRGFDGVLVGEQFMKSSRPGAACARIIRQLEQLYE